MEGRVAPSNWGLDPAVEEGKEEGQGWVGASGQFFSTLFNVTDWTVYRHGTAESSRAGRPASDQRPSTVSDGDPP